MRNDHLDDDVSASPREWARRWMVYHSAGRPLDDLSTAMIMADAEEAGIPVAEALRQVAIACEDWADTPTPCGSPRWPSLRSLYAMAHALDPEDSTVLDSAALSALWLAPPDLPAQAAARSAMVLEARELAGRAVDLAPQDAHHRYVLGMAWYEGHGPQAIEAALHHFHAALDLDVACPWAALYTAHCLQDLERWGEAASAYDRVSIQGFDVPRRWRGHLAAEQRAYCLLMAGERARAEAAFEGILADYEAALAADLSEWESPVLEAGPPEYLREAVDSGAMPSLAVRARALFDALDARE